MWIYDSPIGKIEIKFDCNVKKYALWLGDECGGFYPTPEAAADDVYTQTSGIDAIDYLKDSKSNILPHDLGDWNKIPDKQSSIGIVFSKAVESFPGQHG